MIVLALFQSVRAPKTRDAGTGVYRTALSPSSVTARQRQISHTLLCPGIKFKAKGGKSDMVWERDLRTWGVREQVLDELKKLAGERPEIVMAYHELLNPDTFDYCCQRVQAAINVHDPEQMEDILVGVLAHILHRLVSTPDEFTFEDREAVRRYLRGAMRNVCRKIIASNCLPVTDPNVLARMSVVEITQQQEYLRLELQQVLSVLPPHQAVVMALYVRGYRIAEISARLQIPKGTVQSRLHRARQRLADA